MFCKLSKLSSISAVTIDPTDVMMFYSDNIVGYKNNGDSDEVEWKRTLKVLNDTQWLTVSRVAKPLFNKNLIF